MTAQVWADAPPAARPPPAAEAAAAAALRGLQALQHQGGEGLHLHLHLHLGSTLHLHLGSTPPPAANQSTSA